MSRAIEKRVEALEGPNTPAVHFEEWWASLSESEKRRRLADVAWSIRRKPQARRSKDDAEILAELERADLVGVA